MASKTDIVNAALIRLGQAPVSSLDEGSKEAVYAKQIFDTELEELLAEGMWYCAYTTVPLAKLTVVPSNFSYAYQLPNNCITPVRIELDNQPFFFNQLTYNESALSRQSAYRIEKNRLCTNASSVTLGYISRIAASALDANLTGVFITKLALALSYSLTASNTNVQLIDAEYKRKLKAAKGKNALLMQQYHADVAAIQARRVG